MQVSSANRRLDASTLATLRNRPARLLVPGASPRSGLFTHTGEGALLEMLDPLVSLPAGIIVVEVVSPEGLLRFRTSMQGPGLGSRRLRVHLPEEVEVIQRRRHARVSVQLTGSIANADDRHPVAVYNLSPGGAAMSLPIGSYQPVVGENLTFELNADPLQFSQLPARVVRSSLREAEFTIAVQFINVTPVVEGALTGYCRLLQERRIGLGGQGRVTMM